MIRMAKSIGMFLLVFQILFISTGFHDLTCHSAAPPATTPASQREFSSPKLLDNPETDHCNACFFNKLLNQCVFPAFEGPFIAESFIRRTPLCPGSIVFIAPGKTGNRGPPLLLS